MAPFVVRRAERLLERHVAIRRNQQPFATRHDHRPRLGLRDRQGVVEDANVANILTLVADFERAAVGQ